MRSRTVTRTSEPTAPAGRPAKLGEIIANEIEREIVRIGWPTGQILATEAELVAQFGASRATIREAISQIERRGIATMRRGNGGGLVVSAPARFATVRALATYIELANASYESILETRELLELQSVSLAARRLDEKTKRVLQAKTQQLRFRTGSVEEDAKAHMAVREAIVVATGNPLLALFIEALDSSSHEITLASTVDSDAFNDVIAATSVVKGQMVEAIIACDPSAAQELVRRNTALQLSAYQAESPRQLRKRQAAKPLSERLKLGHALALRISQDIRLEQWKPGFRLGSEPELMKKYKISRAAFREAVRLLEAHSVAKMQRGSGGGLVVDTPDPTHTISAATLYIDYMRPSPKAMHEVREPLESGAVYLAAQRATREDIENLKSAALNAALAADAMDEFKKSIIVHQTICQACHNPVLSLLTQVIIRSISNTYDTTTIRRDMAREVGISHQKIIAAIVAHSEGDARRRILDHLALIQRWDEILGRGAG